MAVWSGDRARREADGLLYFAGRRDAMIKSAGNRISPQEIEEAALATGLVAEAVAWACLTSGWGRRCIWWCGRLPELPMHLTSCRAG